MAELLEFQALAEMGCFSENGKGTGLWKLVPGAKVVVVHNNKEHELTGFKDSNAEEDRNSVQHLNARRENYRYIPMRYVWIDPDQLRLPTHIRGQRQGKR